jgi:DNA primase
MGRRLLMNFYINKILQERTITSYLEEKGILPQKTSGDKKMYCCPIHSGDNDPSFVVYPVGYKGREYQTYYCFGCHSGITLINLKSDLEQISRKACIKYFIKDVKIEDEDVERSIIEDAKKEKLGIEENHGVEFILLAIHATCRRHVVEACCLDDEEMAFFEIFLEKVERVARSRNADLLNGVYDILVDGITKRDLGYKKRQEEKELSSLNWKI